MQLTNLQSEKVNEIVSCYGKEREIQFKAPTGSGKTLMATNVIAEIINNNPDERFIFIIATVSTSNLPQAFETKINEYKSDLPVSDFEVEYIESPSATKDNKSDSVSQLKIVKNKVYIFGKATFGKGRIFTEQSVITDFIMECKTLGYKVIYIRDEAHIGTKSDTKDTGVQTFEKLLNENADFILKMTATFDKKTSVRRIELKESDLINLAKNENRWLIKQRLHRLNDNTTSDTDLLKYAISKFKEVQENYKSLIDVQIRPAMLIQVDNEPTDTERKIAFQNQLSEIKAALTKNGLSWVQYFGDGDKDCSNVDNKNFTLPKITRNNDTTDCIIFKIGPATGWDIPRACMLLQLRNVCSSNLNIQTIGRIKRNPYPNLEKHDITDRYYIFTNAPKTKDSDYSIYDYSVKDYFKNEDLAIIKIIKKGKTDIDAKQLNTEIKHFLDTKHNELSVRINECFEDNIYKERDKKLVIKNPVLILKRIKSLSDNLTGNQRKVIDIIQTHYKKYFPPIKWEQLQIVLLNYYTGTINNIYKKCMPFNLSYKIELERVKPDIYQEIFEKSDDNKISVSDPAYLFNITENGKITNIQQLDSPNEKLVSDKLKAHFETFPVKVWAKNQTTSNIFGEYLDDSNNDRKSYFDFVVKFENGNYLYLEVKGNDDSDIDKEKTKQLAKAYDDYFNNMNYGLFSQKIVICILKVDGDTIFPECFYDERIIKTDLKGATLAKIIQELAK